MNCKWLKVAENGPRIWYSIDQTSSLKFCSRYRPILIPSTLKLASITFLLQSSFHHYVKKVRILGVRFTLGQKQTNKFFAIWKQKRFN